MGEAKCHYAPPLDARQNALVQSGFFVGWPLQAVESDANASDALERPFYRFAVRKVLAA